MFDTSLFRKVIGILQFIDSLQFIAETKGA